VHDGPNLRKLETLREQLSVLGLFLSGGDEPGPKDYAALMQRVAHRPDADNIQLLLLRSLTQAVYEPELRGHFGLALAAYTHFTSPIRRYPDLVVHRAIKAQLRKTDPKLAGNDGAVQYDSSELDALGASCSMTERRADEASRDVTSWLKCEYMQDKLGEEFLGRVVSVAGFGLFVELDEVFVEGLVHVSSLRNDYYQYDAARQQLCGERSGERFALGDRIWIRVAGVDLDQRKIDFHFVKRGDGSGESRAQDDDSSDEALRARRLASIRKALARDGAHSRSDKERADERRARTADKTPRAAGKKKTPAGSGAQKQKKRSRK
jgi:ribonuclease R